jgi:hypothetical protein
MFIVLFFQLFGVLEISMAESWGRVQEPPGDVKVWLRASCWIFTRVMFSMSHREVVPAPFPVHRSVCSAPHWDLDRPTLHRVDKREGDRPYLEKDHDSHMVHVR